MTKVFIGGTRKVTKLNKSIKNRLDNIINKGFSILVGDANGVDKAVQKYLYEKKYNNVFVFCSGNACRNNIGNWITKNIETITDKKDFNFYVIKDLEMVKETDYGFMIWDAKSKGTLNNIINLLKIKKNTLVYYTPEKKFYTLTTFEDLGELLVKSDKKSLDLFEKTLNILKILEKEKQELQTA